jgi:hypothetical protein
MAYQGHIVVPTTHEKADEVIDSIEAKMATTFGGYSRYEGTGGWDGKSDIVTEDHVRLVVNTTEWDRHDFKTYLRTEALYVKDVLDEDAVLIEIRDIEMELV